MAQIILTILLFSSAAFATKPKRPFFDHSHQEWTEQLQNYVQVKGPMSSVNYSKWKSQQAALDKYLSHLSDVPKRLYITWNDSQKKAFLINAYNAFTVKLILQNHPVKSINDITPWYKKALGETPWKIKFIQLLDSKIDLDTIEHKMLRKDFQEPRVHFALNCASIGCPMLKNEAYTPLKLHQQLEEQTILFLNDKTRNSIDESNKKLKLSMIFDWFKEDFTNHGRTVTTFVLPFMSENKQIQKHSWNIEYFQYNWLLNE